MAGSSVARGRLLRRLLDEMDRTFRAGQTVERWYAKMGLIDATGNLFDLNSPEAQISPSDDENVPLPISLGVVTGDAARQTFHSGRIETPRSDTFGMRYWHDRIGAFAVELEAIGEMNDGETLRRFQAGLLSPTNDYADPIHDAHEYTNYRIAILKEIRDWLYNSLMRYDPPQDEWLLNHGAQPNSEMGEAGTGGLAIPLPTVRWNRDTRELTVGSSIARKLRGLKVAANIVKILDAFELDGWPPHIDSPFTSDESGKEKLRAAIRTLNSGLQYLRFEADGSGEGVVWQRVS